MLERALQTPAWPGAPDFERLRPSIVARAKSEPVVFLRAPVRPPELSKILQAERDVFERTDYAWRTLRALLERYEDDKPTLRKLLLSEGYLYSEDPNRAFTLVSLLTPALLFEREEIWIQRGEQLFHARPNAQGDYEFSDGPEAGKRVRLFHLDRVGTGRVPTPLHVDFRALRYRLFFERARIRHLSEHDIVADLRYGEFWIPTVLRVEGARLERVAEVVPPEQRAALSATRKELERKMRAVSQLRAAMRAAIDEGLPFDEPKNEIGQEDGRLRAVWNHAYFSGRDSFKYNDDRYWVFGSSGQPLVPQVCIDFMVDTFERASGAWWRPKQDGMRERTAGKLDWGDVSRDDLRRTQFFVKLAEQRADWFDVLDFPPSERVELGYKDRFFEWLAKRADAFDAADIVLIRGMTPWDELEEHTHTFFVYETCPITGVPIAIAGNAGPANLWSWETEARRTPHRTLRTRIRPKLTWLESFLETEGDSQLRPPALVSGKK
jgi:hypothetical protein